jgi:uncharacterized repeat protein (TIGR03803 family)
MLTATLDTLASFDGTNGGRPGGLVVSGGRFYGEASTGGASRDGELFSLPLSGGTPTVLASFDGTNGSYPLGGLAVIGSFLYGVAQSGGTHNAGVVFSVPISGGPINVLYSFDGITETQPSSLISDGNVLYGTTEGVPATVQGTLPATIFSLPITGGTPTVLTSFPDGLDDDGLQSYLVLSGNTLYGEDLDGGSHVFSLPITGGTRTVLCSLESSGLTDPYGLMLSGGTLYSTALGDGNYGRIFSIPTSGGAPKIIASFKALGLSTGQLVLSGNTLYGDGTFSPPQYGKLFDVPLAGGGPVELASLEDGNYFNGLILSGGQLYGATTGDGFGDQGEIFHVSLSPGPTSIELASSHVPVHHGEHVTLSATLSAVGGLGGTATGTVTFYDDGKAIGAAQPLAGGLATVDDTTLPIGSDRITATYSGDINFASSTTASALIVTVRPQPTGTVPTIVSATTSASTHGYTIAASVIATDTGPGGAAGLKYIWSAIHLPPGAKMPTFNVNGTNAAKNIIAHFTKAGGYILQCEVKNAAGNAVTTDVAVTVSQKATSLKIEPHGARIAKDGTLQYRGAVLDQFGHPMQAAQTLDYIVTAGSGSISSSGLFSASSIAGPVTVELEADDLTSTVGAVVG